MMYGRECLYNVNWQSIRVDMLGTWTSVDNVRKNIVELDEYCTAASAIDKWERYTRVTNYLAAIMLGYGNKVEWAEQKRIVKQAHDVFSGRMYVFKPYYSPWNWDVVKCELETADGGFLKRLLENLNKRVNTSVKRTGGTQHRPELVKFLDLLKQEIARRFK
jgi:hypothetical protein